MLTLDSALPIKESAISLSDSDNDPATTRRTSRAPSMSSSPRRHHVDAEEVQIVLDVDKLADSDNENGSDFNANECLKDGHKSKHIENVRVPKGEGKHRHPLMVGAKLTE